MLPVIYALMRSYAPYITLPVSIIIGVIGYNIEGLISDKYTPTKKLSFEEERLERQLQEMENSSATSKSLKTKYFVPKTIFEKNTST
uniref:Small integral membrane protein 12 n=1 Tax=Parasteatoda tepidariorum TaxID=114398 RepID=A0A2L2YAM7_PARTP